MQAVIYRSTKRILRCRVRIFPPTELAYAYDAEFSIGIFPNEHEMRKWERDFKPCLIHNDMELVSSKALEVWPTATPDIDFDWSEQDGLPFEVAPVLPQLTLKRCLEKNWSRSAHSK